MYNYRICFFRNKSYNAALLINRKGKIVGNYKKRHLFGEKSDIHPGGRSIVFKTDFAKIGIAICWDLAFPELFSKMKNDGAQIIFCPSQWWYDSAVHDEKKEIRELEILKSLLKARAYENIFYVALCNPVMDSKYQISYSAITSPTKILKEISKREGLIVAKVNLKRLKKFQEVLS